MALFFVILLFFLPGQSYMSYRKYSLYTLCPLERTNSYNDGVYHSKDRDTTTIDLHDSPLMSSVLLEHAWNNSSNKHFHQCEFNVKTRSRWMHGPSSGLFAGIRELNFRQNSAGECIDYVIFELNTLTAPTSHKICGTVSADDKMLDEKNYFEVPEGSLKIIIHIGTHDLAPNDIIMKLIFTAFEDCNGSYQFRCTNSRCISESLFNDLVVNCIPPFCSDEPRFYRKCGTIPVYSAPNSHILAVGSTVVLVIFGVAMAWYFLKIYVNCNRYFGHRVPPSATTELNALEPFVEYRTAYGPPAADNTIGGQSDNPPSYDSLFKNSS